MLAVCWQDPYIEKSHKFKRVSQKVGLKTFKTSHLEK